MTKVLILDQSKSVRNILRERLEYEGFSAEAVENEAAASALCERIPFDVILSDTECKVPDAGIPFIALSADTSIDTAVKAVRNGAQDFLTKPIDMNRLLQSLHRTIDNPAPAQAPPAAPPVRRRRAHSAQAERIIGVSPEIEHVRQLIDKVAPCEARVLITGENGTGKELVARWLHAKSVRAAAPFVEVNCAAIPEMLLESELFGYEKGAFTGAVENKSGVFAAADHGTLFLDEVGNLNMETQVQLLRALQEKRYKLVGGTEEMHADVRLLAATNEDLEQAISEGRFREDLFHRLNEFPLHVPPLIDCREDIIPLAGFFLSFANEELEKKIRGFDRDVREAFVSYPWPGNIRELKNVVRRACVLAQGGWITLKEISLPVNVPPSNNYRLDMERTEQEAIQKALETTGNDRKAAARLLGISRSTLYLKLKKYGLI